MLNEYDFSLKVDRTEAFAPSKIENSEKVLHVFTSTEGISVKVYEDCACGVCSCKYKIGGEMTQNPVDLLIYN